MCHSLGRPFLFHIYVENIIISFPGSAWERTAPEALPRFAVQTKNECLLVTSLCQGWAVKNFGVDGRFFALSLVPFLSGIADRWHAIARGANPHLYPHLLIRIRARAQ